jgi:membrane-associated phospholipid phosphatase
MGVLILRSVVGKLIRTAAWTVVVAGIAAPLIRRRFNTPAPVTIATAYAAPVAFAVAVPTRSRARDVGLCLLQMWAYVAAYKMPADDPDHLEERVFVDYPILVDRVLGLGQTPTQRLQRSFAHAGEIRGYERVLVWSHWVWFAVPHGTVVWMLVRHPERFPRAALMTYATFNIGCVIYWIFPTAPPWYAAELGRIPSPDPEAPRVRRMMLEEGQRFWKDNWASLYDALAGNPYAAMPSLHFGTSVMAARLLADAGPVPGAVGAAYAATLGTALVYLGEHYVVDLIAGAVLAEGVRAAGPRVAPAMRRVSGVFGALQRRALA